MQANKKLTDDITKRLELLNSKLDAEQLSPFVFEHMKLVAAGLLLLLLLLLLLCFLLALLPLAPGLATNSAMGGSLYMCVTGVAILTKGRVGQDRTEQGRSRCHVSSRCLSGVGSCGTFGRYLSTTNGKQESRP